MFCSEWTGGRMHQAVPAILLKRIHNAFIYKYSEMHRGPKAPGRNRVAQFQYALLIVTNKAERTASLGYPEQRLILGEAIVHIMTARALNLTVEEHYNIN